MTNQSIKLAFGRFWQHVIAKLNNYATTESLNNAIADIELRNLPSVTTADNGKVLMVVDGTWQATTLSAAVNTDDEVSV